MKNTLYLPNDEHRTVDPANGNQFTLDELRELVGGEPYALVLEDSGTAMVGAEDVRQPINHAATEVTQHWIGPYTEVFGRALHCPTERIPTEILPGGELAK